MCSICDLRIEFSVDHPLSLSVAVATRRAIDAGVLPEPEVEDDALAAMRLRVRAIETLKAAQRRLEQSLSQKALLAVPDFYVLMVESRVWGFFRATAAGFDANCRPGVPNVGEDAVVVASELAMGAVVAGRLPFERALEERVVVVDADEGRRGALVGAWGTAYPRVGFSRFVCV